MSNLTELINQIPQMPRRQIAPTTVQDATSASIQQVLRFIAQELPIKRDLQNSQDLHKKLSELVNNLERLIERNDTATFTKDVTSAIAELAEKVSNPQITVETDSGPIRAVEKAIKALKFVQKDSFEVTNLKDLIRAVNELKPLLNNLETAIQESKSEKPEPAIDKETKGYLKNLQFLDTDAKNPLAVRLSDGKEFINQLKSVDSGIRAMTGSSGNNFNLPNMSPTKANVDPNGNIKVVQDVYTVKIAYASAGKPEYIGKAAPGSASSAAGWQISKLTYSTDDVTDIQWAGGSLSFTNVWDDRASLSYS